VNRIAEMEGKLTSVMEEEARQLEGNVEGREAVLRMGHLDGFSVQTRFGVTVVGVIDVKVSL
jgi:hypothetical protein